MKITRLLLFFYILLFLMPSVKASAEIDVITKTRIASGVPIKLVNIPLRDAVRLICGDVKCQFIDVQEEALAKECSINMEGTTEEALQYLASSNDMLLSKNADAITFRGLDSFSFTFRKAPTGSSFSASFYEGEMGGVTTTSTTGGVPQTGTSATGGATAAAPQQSFTGNATGQQGVSITNSADKLDFWDEMDKSLKKIVSARGFYTIDRSSSLVYVVDKPSRLKLAHDYLEAIDKNLNRQVQIEVTVIQVQKGGSTSLGVDWDSVLTTVGKQVLQFSTTGAFTDPNSAFSIGAKLVTPTATHSAVIKGVAKFADVKIVEKTNMLLRNNVAGSFSRGIQRSYIDSISRTIVTDQTTTSVVKGTILSGLNIYVIPTIIGDTVTLTFMPRITELQDIEVIKIENGSIQNPIIDMRKNVITVTLKSGETKVVSSISSDTKGRQDNSVPGLGSIPVLGWLFGNRTVTDENTAVMFIVTPTIIDI